MNEDRVLKTYEIRKADLKENRIAGAASVMGNLDRGSWWGCKDVVAPGAFKDCLRDFMVAGFVSDSHDWTVAGMHAMPELAEERGAQLYTEAEFHSTPDSQIVRTKCQERLDRGKSIGLSIGFRIGEKMYFPSGKALWEWAEKAGHDMSLYEAGPIMSFDGECRLITKVAELFEYAITPVPMNPKATAIAAKHFQADEGSRAGLTLADHLDLALAAVGEAIGRLDGWKAMKEGEGRPIPEERKAQAKTLRDQLDAWLLAVTPEPEPEDDHEATYRELSMRTVGARLAAEAAQF